MDLIYSASQLHMPHQLDHTSFLASCLLAKQLFTYIFRLRSTSFGLAITITNDVMAFNVEDDEGTGWELQS